METNEMISYQYTGNYNLTRRDRCFVEITTVNNKPRHTAAYQR